MNNLTDPVRLPLSSRDLPLGMTRESPSIWCDRSGQRYEFVPRRQVRHLSPEDRARALVVLRFRPGFHPVSVEGAVVRSLLLDGRVMYLNALLPRLQAWYAEDAWPFFLRAIVDKRAFVSVVLRLDKR